MLINPSFGLPWNLVYLGVKVPSSKHWAKNIENSERVWKSITRYTLTKQLEDKIYSMYISKIVLRLHKKRLLVLKMNNEICPMSILGLLDTLVESVPQTINVKSFWNVQ